MRKVTGEVAVAPLSRAFETMPSDAEKHASQMWRRASLKIPPDRRKTAYASLRRIANRMGVRFQVGSPPRKKAKMMGIFRGKKPK